MRRNDNALLALVAIAAIAAIVALVILYFLFVAPEQGSIPFLYLLAIYPKLRYTPNPL